MDLRCPPTLFRKHSPTALNSTLKRTSSTYLLTIVCSQYQLPSRKQKHRMPLQKNPNRTCSIAPMMSYTDRHFRHFVRLMSKCTLLYTEMVVSGTIIHNLSSEYLDKILGFDADQPPLAVQLGGDCPDELETAARVCEDYGYQEINLNIGCPSDRVQKGSFGAVLMKTPEKVADLYHRMQRAVQIPVTVKHRIGVDDLDSYEFLSDFVDTVSKAGCRSFSIHARKAWLKGLSPAQNRSVPPLDYERVYQLKADFPDLEIVLNGGIDSLDQARQHLEKVDGVMIGRAAYRHPLLCQHVDEMLFNDHSNKAITTGELLCAFQDYMNRELSRGTPASSILRHLLGFFKGEKGSRIWRQRITSFIQTKEPLTDLALLYNETIGRFKDE
ncbi:MAG: tRNA dihydrouridine(20/20a) synthase DusA [Acidobacteria bacterium]|nr:MAG: tRNA dihydrouridine(20/20a) synthase DusA [Acidobacteriota bacterium]